MDAIASGADRLSHFHPMSTAITHPMSTVITGEPDLASRIQHAES